MAIVTVRSRCDFVVLILILAGLLQLENFFSTGKFSLWILLRQQHDYIIIISQVILATNIAESSITVPDIKYGRLGAFFVFS